MFAPNETIHTKQKTEIVPIEQINSFIEEEAKCGWKVISMVSKSKTEVVVLLETKYSEYWSADDY